MILIEPKDDLIQREVLVGNRYSAYTLITDTLTFTRVARSKQRPTPRLYKHVLFLTWTVAWNGGALFRPNHTLGGRAP